MTHAQIIEALRKMSNQEQLLLLKAIITELHGTKSNDSFKRLSRFQVTQAIAEALKSPINL